MPRKYEIGEHKFVRIYGRPRTNVSTSGRSPRAGTAVNVRINFPSFTSAQQRNFATTRNFPRYARSVYHFFLSSLLSFFPNFIHLYSAYFLQLVVQNDVIIIEYARILTSDDSCFELEQVLVRFLSNPLRIIVLLQQSFPFFLFRCACHAITSFLYHASRSLTGCQRYTTRGRRSCGWED